MVSLELKAEALEKIEEAKEAREAESQAKIEELEVESENILEELEQTKDKFEDDIVNSAEKAEKLLKIADAPKNPDNKGANFLSETFESKILTSF